MKDVLIIGGGHNGLVCASYLARAGFQVTICERRALLGGAAVTQEFHPGYRNSTASYAVSLLHPKVISDLRLQDHGLRIVERPHNNHLPLPNGDSFTVFTRRDELLAEVARFSSRDAASLPDYEEMLSGARRMIAPYLLETPPATMHLGVSDLWPLLRRTREWRRLGEKRREQIFKLMTRSAGDILDSFFESDPLKAVLGFDSIVGSFTSPYSAGSGYILLHHVMGETAGQNGVWGHAVGGMGAITEAMVREAAQLGVEFLVSSPVRRVLVTRGQAVGLELESGERIAGDVIASSVNPQLLFLHMLEESQLPPGVVDHFRHYRNVSASFRMNVALAELPAFRQDRGERPADYHGAGIILGPSLGYMDRAYVDARRTGLSNHPIVEMLIPSTIDDTLAPAGCHVASLFCQHFDPGLDDGWARSKQAAIDLVLDTVDAYAPNFRSSILGYEAYTPLDLEREFGLTGGDIFHGCLSWDQLYIARPKVGLGHYRGPLKNLYLCGSGSHPGGGVSGLPGHNGAREIIRDHG